MKYTIPCQSTYHCIIYTYITKKENTIYSYEIAASPERQPDGIEPQQLHPVDHHSKVVSHRALAPEPDAPQQVDAGLPDGGLRVVRGDVAVFLAGGRAVRKVVITESLWRQLARGFHATRVHWAAFPSMVHWVAGLRV